MNAYYMNVLHVSSIYLNIYTYYDIHYILHTTGVCVHTHVRVYTCSTYMLYTYIHIIHIHVEHVVLEHVVHDMCIPGIHMCTNK
jgi:hypothetical protein